MIYNIIEWQSDTTANGDYSGYVNVGRLIVADTANGVMAWRC
jgi:hypothetical protein